MTLLLALAVPLALYELLVRWQMAQPVDFKYNAVLARVGRFLTRGRMVCLSLWRTAWLLYPPTHPRAVAFLTDIPSRKHEVDGHILNPDQWAGYPRTFPFRYLWELRKGYACSRYEEDARRIAGQPLRCGG